MKYIKMEVESTSFTCGYYDFDLKKDGKDVTRWQQAYFELLSWKNTWGIPLILDMRSTSQHEAFIELVVPREDKDTVREYLQSLGYINLSEYDTMTLQVFFEWDDKYDDVVADFDI